MGRESKEEREKKIIKSSSAYVIYRPNIKEEKNRIFFSEEARSVFSPPAPEGEKVSIPDISTLCKKWKKSLDQMEEAGEVKGHIDILQSWRRRYTVRGVRLIRKVPHSRKEEENYLFIIERLNPNNLNISELLKKWNLNRREEEIVRLIIEDYGNKEIAYRLGISINTVKGYLKLLMRKLGVHTRAGLISTILTGAPSPPPSPQRREG